MVWPVKSFPKSNWDLDFWQEFERTRALVKLLLKVSQIFNIIDNL